jgi:F-type H+-transporting ATPase subunit epsilon
MLHARFHEGTGMKSFTVQLLSARSAQRIDDVTGFIGEDATGSFGLLANHTRFMTALRPGLARIRVGEQPWQYLAAPRALLYFADNMLTFTTRRYVIDSDYGRISHILQRELMAEEQELRSVRRSLQAMEEHLLKRLWQLGRTVGRET